MRKSVEYRRAWLRGMFLSQEGPVDCTRCFSVIAVLVDDRIRDPRQLLKSSVDTASTLRDSDSGDASRRLVLSALGEVGGRLLRYVHVGSSMAPIVYLTSQLRELLLTEFKAELVLYCKPDFRPVRATADPLL